MIKRMIVMLLLVGFVLGGIFGFKFYGNMKMMEHMAASGNPAQTVSAIVAQMEEWQPTLKAVGTLRAVKGADLAAEVSGIVEAIHFESGSEAEEGALLVQLRNADDLARLEALQSAARLAEITLQRDEKQLKSQAISQATYDNDAANLTAARAAVENQKAVLDKKAIRAPFAGHLGIRAVDVGQYLNPGSPIVTLQQLDPIFLDFYLPQQSLPQILVGQKVTAKTDAHPDKTFEGEITAIDAKVDVSTRNVLIRATFKNPERLLLPGMYAEAAVASGKPERYLTLPQTSITYNPYGNTVFVVGTDGKGTQIAKQVFVTTGATRGDQIAILSGIKEGDTIVTSGQLKLRNGSPVTINNNIQPSNDPHPKPEDN